MSYRKIQTSKNGAKTKVKISLANIETSIKRIVSFTI